jgi:hypothetical protein
MTPRRWLIALLAALTVSAAAADVTGALWLGWVFISIAVGAAFYTGARWDQLTLPGKHHGGE